MMGDGIAAPASRMALEHWGADGMTVGADAATYGRRWDDDVASM
jgi:hypothetical protein